MEKGMESGVPGLKPEFQFELAKIRRALEDITSATQLRGLVLELATQCYGMRQFISEMAKQEARAMRKQEWVGVSIPDLEVEEMLQWLHQVARTHPPSKASTKLTILKLIDVIGLGLVQYEEGL